VPSDLALWDVAELSPAETTVFARELPDDTENILSRFLPDRTIAGIETESTTVTRRRLTTKYRTWNAEVPVGERPTTVTSERLQLPPLGQLLILTEWERLLIELARNGGNVAPLLTRIIEQSYDDIANNVAATRNRVEMARGDFFMDGKFTLLENGVVQEYDAGLPAENTTAPAIDWDATNATPMSDEVTWNRKVRKKSLSGAPTWALTDSTTVDFMRNNAEYRSAFWPTLPEANAPRLSLDQLNSVRASEGLPPITTYEHQLEVRNELTGAWENKWVIEPGRFIFGTAGVGETQWGWTVEMLSMMGSNAIDLAQQDAPGITALAWKKPNPVTGYTQVAATVMPVAGDIGGLYSTTVRDA
jgi:hypothetical protein